MCVVEASVAEQLELECNDGLTLLTTQTSTEGRLNAAFIVADSVDDIDTRRDQ